MASTAPCAALQPAARGSGQQQQRPTNRTVRLRSEDAILRPTLAEVLLRSSSRRPSLRPAAYLAPSDEPQGLGGVPDYVASTAGGDASAPLALQAASSSSGAGAAASLAPVPSQELGGASLLQLVAAWDQLAARLPPQAGAGRGAEVILDALKLALAHAPAAPARPASAAGDTAQPQLARPVARALSLASRLADLAADGLPVDAESIAAAILAEVLLAGADSPGAWHPTAAAEAGSGGGGSGEALTLRVIEERVGPIVAQLVHDVQRARQLPARVELLDDTAASALRELCLSFYDVRATAVEVVSRLDLLCSPGQPVYEQQVSALEALQMYAPMGHALGLGPVAQQLEDRCFQILFPESYVRTAAWLRDEAAANADTLDRCKAALTAAVARSPRFAELAAGLTVHGRTKTLFSTLKKLLRLGNTAAGGRARAQVFDLMGLRAIVQPRTDLPPEEAEALAAQACYLVRDAACSLWDCLPERAKDYIAAPKANGYQSLHSTVRVRCETVSLSLGSDSSDSGDGDARVHSTATLELQIRTQAMHERAEFGEAAHGAYKGGLGAAQAAQLKSVTDAVLRRAAAAAATTVAAEPADASASRSTSSGDADAAADSLFRHLDQNGDGRISLEELQFALQELGVVGEQAQSRAAAELLQMACADDGAAGSSNSISDTIDYDTFMAFQRRVGLLQALSAVDHQQAHALEEQHAVSVGPAAAHPAGSSDDEGSRFTDPLPSSGLFWSSGSFDGGDAGASGSSRLAAMSAACRAHGRAGASAGAAALRWQAPVQSGSRARGSFAVRATPVETTQASSAASSSDSDGESDFQADAAEASSSGSGMHVAQTSTDVHHGAAVVQASSGDGSSGEAPVVLQKPQLRPPPSREPAPVEPLSTAAPPTTAVPEEAAASRREAAAVWRASQAVQGIVRFMTGEGPPPADATWLLVPAPCNPHRLTDAVGEPLPETAAPPASLAGSAAQQRVQAARVPEQGPLVIGAVLDRDCDCVLDVPTISGRHARLEAVRRPDAKGGYSKLMLTDLGSTNGTRVNRRLVEPFKEVPLRPGDTVTLAEPDIAFEVQVLPPAPRAPAIAASSAGAATTTAASGTELTLVAGGEVALADQQAAAAQHAVSAALRLAGALEAAAAAQGHFPPGGAVYADVPERARELMAAGSHDQAYALLLAGVMQQPWSGALWAQLANLERQRARRRPLGSGVGGGSYAVARAFFGAAAACFAALTPAVAGGALRAAAERAEGLTRLLASWGQMELQQGNTGAGRALLRRGTTAAREHPAGAAAAGAPRLLVTWATREWKAGQAADAQRLCVEALELEPGNPFALTLLGNIAVAAGQKDVARKLFERALETDPAHTAALQSWARLEATAGSLHRARPLFRRALDAEPRSAFVLQAWGVAEARRGDAHAARDLLRSATEADPASRPAWHAWGKLEHDAGNAELARQLYGKVLELEPASVPALSALGSLERGVGDLAAAEKAFAAALAADPAHLPSLHELAAVREAQGRSGEAAALRRRAQRAVAARSAAMKEVARGRLPDGVVA